MKKKTIIALIASTVMTAFSGMTAYAAGDVAGAVEGTWTTGCVGRGQRCIPCYRRDIDSIVIR